MEELSKSLEKCSVREVPEVPEVQNPSYDEIISTIKKEALLIKLDYSSKEDGRLVSAIKETEFLDKLKIKLVEHGYTVEIPKVRHWFDIKINSIPINLKITSGGTDNAFNKTAIIFSICGVESKSKNMNYNKWYKLLTETPRKKSRDKLTEYHYLVIHKNTNEILVKSIFDIHTYKSNPCNDLQINWDNEFKHNEYKIEDEDFLKKGIECSDLYFFKHFI